MLNQERLARRVEGRKQAREILGLVNLDHPDKVDAFLDELRSALQPKEVEADEKTAKKRLRELAAIQLPRGVNQDKTLDEVPREYLHWWIEDGEEWATKIGEFLEATKHLDDEA